MLSFAFIIIMIMTIVFLILISKGIFGKKPIVKDKEE